MTENREDWQVIAEHKRADRANRLAPYADWSLGDLTPPPSRKHVASLVHARLTDKERSFVASDVTDLVQRLATQKCTAVEVTTAFCKATYAAQELTNCLTEVMFAEALVCANELDKHLSETGQVVGPLHGIPVSVKDHICVKGADTACGYVDWAFKNIAKEDALLVQILRAAGAIIYVKTTNPQGLLALETSSNLYKSTANPHGRTTNPFNRDLAAGGSSGGEAVLIGTGANLLGVGTDLGGSIVSLCVVPAAWCGVYALKPSVHRIPLPSSGVFMPYKGKEDLTLVAGPMTRSVRDLELFCRVVSEYQVWYPDPNTLSIPWNGKIAEGSPSEKLVIGLCIDDGVVAPHPPIIECLKKAREVLVAAGHEVIDWTPIDSGGAAELLLRFYVLDGGKDIRGPLEASGEPAVELIQLLLDKGKELGECTLAESWALNVKRDQLRARALGHWNSTTSQSKCGRPMDVVLCPTAATLAPPHDTTRWVGYGAYWNLLDLPAAVFPSGKPFNVEEWKSGTHPPVGNPRNPIEKFVADQWHPDTYDGAPVGLQLVGRRWQDEKLIAHLKIVDALLNPPDARI
ncbi:glutamyl-tRNA(Gln) amidotransferase subunit A, putative [Rhizoctonia solani AG-3 Rhs1AP]|uniref:Glutamyl-tRNA(Gln) amidotransferase subunit A, putative n=2 Tax=Rhizoctonia solani AG-3 TaxID=1086053 RepID=X8IZ53_9AGAM|nr:glutamyl-tRNA(Gln) amidotransferase subunit A, putative [Rhizoctonia solani AG-3 Rhs1AP]KEP51519.1 putative glutamyl-tRNA(Gln) amidotransferase subunit A [Rhizoctonia solani 123E]